MFGSSILSRSTPGRSPQESLLQRPGASAATTGADALSVGQSFHTAASKLSPSESRAAFPQVGSYQTDSSNVEPYTYYTRLQDDRFVPSQDLTRDITDSDPQRSREVRSNRPQSAAIGIYPHTNPAHFPDSPKEPVVDNQKADSDRVNQEGSDTPVSTVPNPSGVEEAQPGVLQIFDFRFPVEFITVREMKDWVQAFQTRFHDLKETSILYTVGPAAPSPAEVHQSGWTAFQKALLVLRALWSFVDVALHVVFALELVWNEHYDWFGIAVSIIFFRTIVNVVVSKSVAQIPTWYKFVILFQMNFIYDAYQSFQKGNLTPLYQAGKFIQAIIEALPFTLVIACRIYEENTWSIMHISSITVSVISSTLSAWEVSCRDAPSYTKGLRYVASLVYRFAEVLVFASGASLFAHYFGPLLMLLFVFKWAVMGFVSLSRFQERNANTALSVIYGLSILDVAVIFTSAMLPGSRRPTRDVEYFMVADASVGSFYQALLASDFVSGVVISLLLISPSNSYFDSPSDEIRLAFQIFGCALVLKHVIITILALFNIREQREEMMVPERRQKSDDKNHIRLVAT